MNDIRLPDIRATSTGGNEVTQSSFFNPSLITLSSKRIIYFHYYNQYGLKELSTVCGNIQYPNNILPVGFQISSFGYEAYRENLFCLSLGKQLNEHWSLGVNVRYVLFQTELYEEEPAILSNDIGISFLPVDKLLIGLSIQNLSSLSVGNKEIDKKELSAYSIQTGIEWKTINNLLIMGSMEMEASHFSGSIGMEYTLYDTFCIRSGVRTYPMTLSFGAGYRISSFTIDAVAVCHPVLGISSGVGISFSF